MNENKKYFSLEEKLLFDLLKVAFSKNTPSDITEVSKEVIKKYSKKNENINWWRLVTIADKHGVLAILYDLLEGGANLPKAAGDRLKFVSNKIVLQNYHLLFLSKTIIEMMQKEGIRVCLLKGSAMGELYPVPELRKSGDVDLLILNRSDLHRCEEIMNRAGLIRLEEQLANHHIVYKTKDNIDIELHIMFAEPFDNRRTNKYFESLKNSCGEHIVENDIMGVKLPVFDDGYNAFYLLIHMLQHFLRSGFGLKLLCDWTAFWSRDIDREHCEMFLKLVQESGIRKFAQIVTAACVGYMGLEYNNVSFLFEETLSAAQARKLTYSIMAEVMDAEEFGKSSADRMVIVRGEGVAGLVREFHHQMNLNFPRAGKVFVIWPVLWLITLVKFVNNNRKLRRVSSGEILRKAKQRSKLIKELELFK